MKKAGIITLHTISNYGSCLQTYATQKLFEKLGWEAEIIDYYRKDNLPENDVNRAFSGRRLQKYQEVWKKAPWLKSVLSIPMRVIINRQRKPFDDFRNTHLNLSAKRYTSSEDLLQNPPEADLFCTGSDQVWNSIWNNGFESPLYLTFVSADKPKISYAASIGREEIDNWEKPLMREALSRYSALSMREESGIRILEELGFTNAELVLDPTLMLRKEDWRKLASRHPRTDKPYILVYQLNKNSDFVSYSKGISKFHDIPIIKISYGIYDLQQGAKNVITPSVNQLLDLFMHASYVITDSFHATAFALNFEIPFVAIAPERFSTRIRNILELTKTEERLLGDYGDLSLLSKPIDFRTSTQKLDEQRGKSEAFLKRALNM